MFLQTQTGTGTDTVGYKPKAEKGTTHKLVQGIMINAGIYV